MTKVNSRTYRKTVIVSAALIIIAFFAFWVYRTNDKGAARTVPDSIEQTASDSVADGGGQAMEDGSASETDVSGGGIAEQDAAGDADRFFADRMAGIGGGAEAPNSIFSDEGISLLKAAGYDYSQEPIYVGAQQRQQEPGAGDISLIKQLAAKASLYPNSPLSSFNAAAALNAPFDSMQTSAYSSSVAGILLCAYQLIDENEEIFMDLAEKADLARKSVYLTIDDGPSALTRQYLDILSARGIRATFFVIGVNVRKHPDIIQDMYDGGHCIANHSYTHNYDRLYQSASSFKNELERCDKAISDILGFEYRSGVFRFPGGSTYRLASKYKDEAKKLGYSYYDWNCLNGDAQIKNKSPDSLYNYMLSTFKGQDEVILLMHDSENKQTSVDMLERAIDFFIEKNYDFYTLDEK